MDWCDWLILTAQTAGKARCLNLFPVSFCFGRYCRHGATSQQVTLKLYLFTAKNTIFYSMFAFATTKKRHTFVNSVLRLLCCSCPYEETATPNNIQQSSSFMFSCFEMRRSGAMIFIQDIWRIDGFHFSIRQMSYIKSSTVLDQNRPIL